MAVSFANIFMALIETKLIQQSETKHREWKCCVDDVLFSLSLADRDFFLICALCLVPQTRRKIWYQERRNNNMAWN